MNLRVLVPQAISPRAPALGGAVHALEGLSMGTTWAVRLVGPPALRTEAIAQAIQSELDEVVAQMSPWESDSDITRFNLAGAGEWQARPEAFFEVLGYGLAVARDSAGAYDPTAGALVNAWGFGPHGRHGDPDFAPPSPTQIDAARAVSGWQRLEFDAAARRVRQPGGLQIDLSAIAKGYAVDRIAALLAQRFGLDETLVEVGGELRGSGVKPDGQPWWVDLEVLGPDAVQTRVALHGLSVATSGDYRRFFRSGGVSYPHTIDPRNGRPIAHGLALVTVLHERCMAADALSTALTVLGPDEGLAWADARDIAALFITRQPDGGLQERMSRAFTALA
ncbi:MAG TPA: FAD:protein FMN transferase [Rhizobacter sp.]|nr:FAD:protein FMN transferase [Rhizobacter sp.]